MELYFTVNEGSKLYNHYFEAVEDREKIFAAFDAVKEKYGIEATGVVPVKDAFQIQPKGQDNTKFASMLRKNVPGLFKKTSPVAKEWCELVKDIRHMRKPRLIFYFDLSGHRWRERLFHIGTTVYGSIETDGKVDVPDFVTEIKASEFYRVIEEVEEKQK